MNIQYLIYQAERPVSRCEQQAADAIRGELAAALSGLRRGGRRRARGRRVADDDLWPATEVPCYPPAEWVTAGPR